MSVKTTGQKEAEEMLKRYPRVAPRVMSTAIQKAGSVLRDRIKQNPQVPVDTGRMRASISKRRIQKLAAGVFVGVNYGKFVHEGTRRMSARPFIQWTLQGGGLKEIDKILKRAVNTLPTRR
tara:strand:+ start:261 stop:623 length:363 start_codon:yes stop_codon:yes gene_type:complete